MPTIVLSILVWTMTPAICRVSENNAPAESPRIVNIINFIRQCEPRIESITENVLYDTVVSQIFGVYPKSVGSWFIDAVTLKYMAERYGVVASCNCKDQIGTDGYTLWGGYWNQGYYPSIKKMSAR